MGARCCLSSAAAEDEEAELVVVVEATGGICAGAEAAGVAPVVGASSLTGSSLTCSNLSLLFWLVEKGHNFSITFSLAAAVSFAVSHPPPFFALAFASALAALACSAGEAALSTRSLDLLPLAPSLDLLLLLSLS